MTLTIDLSLRSTGYCVWNQGKLIAYGIINTESDESPYARAHYITKELKYLIGNYKVTEILIEAPAYGAKGSMVYVLQGVHFYVCAVITNDVGIELRHVPITTIKKQFTGNGRAKKDEIVKNMPEDILELFKKDYVMSRGLSDLCDAYALGWIQYNERN